MSIQISLNQPISAGSPQPKPPQKVLGLFYKIKDNDGNTKGYIWGTMHSFQVFDFKPVFDEKPYRCFKKSKTLVVELDITKELETQIKESAKTSGRPFDSNKLSERLHKYANDNQSMDLQLLLQAHEDKKDIYELETLEFAQEMQRQSFQEVCKNYSNIPLSEIDARDDLLKEAFLESSEEKFLKFAKCGFSEKLSEQFYDERNQKMAEKIDSLLRTEKGLLFIAVGAGHVSGKAGVPALLSKKWTIQKMAL